MAALLAQLVSVGTENPPGRNYRECADLLERTCRNAGLACERHEFPASAATPDTANESAPSLTATFGNGNRALYFHGHYDVVPAQSAEQFQPGRKEHFVFGRGACDMKGGIVSMFYAIRVPHNAAGWFGHEHADSVAPEQPLRGEPG